MQDDKNSKFIVNIWFFPIVPHTYYWVAYAIINNDVTSIIDIF